MAKDDEPQTLELGKTSCPQGGEGVAKPVIILASIKGFLKNLLNRAPARWRCLAWARARSWAQKSTRLDFWARAGEIF